MSEEAASVGDSGNAPPVTEFKAYKRRFAIGVVVLILNLSNTGMCYNLPDVSFKAADYFQVTPSDITWFTQVYYLTPIVFFPMSTYVFDKYDMRVGVNLGSALNLLGASVRAVATSGLITGVQAQFALSLFGQALVGIGSLFILYIVTKVTQNWFPDNERMLATTLLACTPQLAISIASIMSPMLVATKKDIPTLNYVYWGLALLGEGATLLCVTRSRPPTPPSRSADHGKERRPPFLQQLKDIVTCPAFLLLFMVCCAVSGHYVCILTLSQQILCAVGYSDLFSGTVVSSFIFSGFVGSILLAFVVRRVPAYTPIIKAMYALTALFLTVLMEMYLIPSQPALLLLSSIVYGLFGGGVWPLTLEMSVETTYPVEETISSSLILIACQLAGSAMIFLTTALSTELPRGLRSVETCTEGVTSDLQARGYAVAVTVLMVIVSLTVIVFIVFFRTKYRRKEEEKKNSSPSSSSSSSSTRL